MANITATIRSKSIILLAYPGIQYFAEVFFSGAIGWLVGYMMMSNCAMGGGMQLWCYRTGIIAVFIFRDCLQGRAADPKPLSKKKEKTTAGVMSLAIV